MECGRWMQPGMKSDLSAICSYVKEKVPVDTLTQKNYVSTENMMPNKGK